MNAPTKTDYASIVRQMHAALDAGDYDRVRALATILPKRPPEPELELGAPAPEASAPAGG